MCAGEICERVSIQNQREWCVGEIYESVNSRSRRVCAGKICERVWFFLGRDEIRERALRRGEREEDKNLRDKVMR